MASDKDAIWNLRLLLCCTGSLQWGNCSGIAVGFTCSQLVCTFPSQRGISWEVRGILLITSPAQPHSRGWEDHTPGQKGEGQSTELCGRISDVCPLLTAQKLRACSLQPSEGFANQPPLPDPLQRWLEDLSKHLLQPLPLLLSLLPSIFWPSLLISGIIWSAWDVPLRLHFVFAQSRWFTVGKAALKTEASTSLQTLGHSFRHWVWEKRDTKAPKTWFTTFIMTICLRATVPQPVVEGKAGADTDSFHFLVLLG